MLAHLDTTAPSALVTLTGRLTFAENAAFRQVADGLQHCVHDTVVIDLSGVEFIDSAGMGLLLVARDLVAAKGGRVLLRNAGGQVARMLRLAQFGDFFTLDFSCAQV